jgi:hypothetical protein
MVSIVVVVAVCVLVVRVGERVVRVRGKEDEPDGVGGRVRLGLQHENDGAYFGLFGHLALTLFIHPFGCSPVSLLLSRSAFGR